MRKHRNALARAHDNRETVLDAARLEIRKWYLLNSKAPDGAEVKWDECDLTDAFGLYTWWIEPQIKGIPNPKLYAHEFGGNRWECTINLEDPVIKSFGGL